MKKNSDANNGKRMLLDKGILLGITSNISEIYIYIYRGLKMLKREKFERLMISPHSVID